MKGLTPKERKDIHILCDQIGLHHNSVLTKKNKKHMHIIKPKAWKWEFSEKNQYSRPNEYYEERNIKYKDRMSRLECYNCGAT